MGERLIPPMVLESFFWTSGFSLVAGLRGTDMLVRRLCLNKARKLYFINLKLLNLAGMGFWGFGVLGFWGDVGYM